MCTLFYENRMGIKKKKDKFAYLFCSNTGTKFREPYHSNHVIPHRGLPCLVDLKGNAHFEQVRLNKTPTPVILI